MEADHRKRQEKIGRTFSFFSLCFGNEYDVQDLSAMSENMLGEAKDLGLGGVWLGGYPKVDRVEWLKKYFDLPEHIKPYRILSFGVPIKDHAPMDKWVPNKIHEEIYTK